MRITLRTLLAYRDRVLSATDHDDLHHRIQQSEAAGNVLKRIHTVATMPNILAPPVLGKGLGGDPNSIAEYLDDALPSAKVPELEKICLVSDAQLAELAHCHEILSTAMSTKVHVPESLKGRVAGLSDTAQRTLLAEEIRSRTQQTPPDQGDASSQSSDQKATLQRVDAAHPTPAPMGRRRVVATQVGGDDSSSTSDAVQVQSPMVASGGNSIKPAGLDLEHSALAHEVPEYLLGASSSQWKMPAAIAVLLGVLLLVAWQALGPWDGISSLLTAEPTGLAVQPEHLAGAKPAENKTNDVVLAPISPPTDAPAGANPTAVDGAATNEPVPSGAASDGATAPPAAESPTESQTPNTPPEAPQADNVAPILAASDALLNWHPQIDRERAAVLLAQTGNGVRRLEPGEGLANEDVLIVPPATRTTLELHNGLLWSTNGATIMRVKQTGGANADSPAVLEPLLCRATVRGAANGRKLELATVVGTYAIELGEAGSRISIEMGFRSTEHGQVHDRGAVQPVMVVIVLEGAASLSTLSPEAQGTSSSLTLGNGWAMVGSEPPQSFALKSIPPWLRRPELARPIDAN